MEKLRDMPHMIACFDGGEWTDTVPSYVVGACLGMTERQVFSRAKTTKPLKDTEIRLIDLTRWPGGKEGTR